MQKKEETFTYEGLGFPVELIDAPMKKVFGEWVIDVDMNKLQLFVFKGLVRKPSPLTGAELKFMRKFLEMSTTELAQKLGVTHAAVVKWEKEKSNIPPANETYMRMLLLECWREGEMISLYKEITPQKLAEARDEKHVPLRVNPKQMRSSAA